jgi:hypothetical protein
MQILLREEWIKTPELRKWSNVRNTNYSVCRCGNDKKHVELWEQDSCVRGRIDSVVCTSCNVLVSFKVIR